MRPRTKTVLSRASSPTWHWASTRFSSSASRPPHASPSRGDSLAQTHSSFEAISDPKLLSVEPARIELVDVEKPMRLSELYKQRKASVPLEEVAALNQLDGDPELRRGQTLKWVGGGAGTRSWERFAGLSLEERLVGSGRSGAGTHGLQWWRWCRDFGVEYATQAVLGRACHSTSRPHGEWHARTWALITSRELRSRKLGPSEHEGSAQYLREIAETGPAGWGSRARSARGAGLARPACTRVNRNSQRFWVCRCTHRNGRRAQTKTAPRAALRAQTPPRQQAHPRCIVGERQRGRSTEFRFRRVEVFSSA